MLDKQLRIEDLEKGNRALGEQITKLKEVDLQMDQELQKIKANLSNL